VVKNNIINTKITKMLSIKIKSIKFKLLILFIFIACSSIQLKAQEKMTKINLSQQQQDPRIYVEIEYSRTSQFGYQTVIVQITNITSDVLRVRMKYTVTSTSGLVNSIYIGSGSESDPNTSVDIKPGEKISDDKYNCRKQFYGECKGKEIKLDDGISCINYISYQIIDIKNLSEEQRKIEIEKQEKQEAYQHKLEQDKIIKKQEDDRAERERRIAQQKKEEDTRRNEQKATSKNSDDNYWQNSNGVQQTKSVNENTNNSVQNTNTNLNQSSQSQNNAQSNNLVNEGNALSKQGDYNGAKQKYQQALQLSPNNAYASGNLNIADLNIKEKKRVEDHNAALLQNVKAELALADQQAVLVTEAVTLGVSIVQKYIAENEQKKEEERLRAIRTRIAEEERLERIAVHNRLVENRKATIAKFPDGKMPLSAVSRKTDEVYFFIYSCDEQSLEREAPEIYISNAFSVQKYSDDTWPFKNKLMEQIGKENKGINFKLSGFYLTQNEAEKQLQILLSSAYNYSFNVNTIIYNGQKAENKTNNENDFWGNKINNNTPDSIKEVPENNTQVDFWGNPIKK